ncbi:hypothetical protein F383_31866 [Gossypium arboreum]|uniref:Uncharacterized protein n=1 Tax=Gossypium arboreum TaxID=29729 RepID=A0A0B0N552_GOSAR|nr:hypothetical protein F383_31866 [Gossypium arboreum]
MSGTCISIEARASVRYVWDMHRPREIQASVRPVWDMASTPTDESQCKTMSETWHHIPNGLTKGL